MIRNNGRTAEKGIKSCGERFAALEEVMIEQR
jgi:hypothetical protein